MGDGFVLVVDRRGVEIESQGETLVIREPDGRRGIPQGAIISPFLCNLYLTGFDHALTDKGISFVRYADDFLLFTAERAQAHQAQKYAEKLLADLGLKLKPSKTRIAGPGTRIEFLGEEIRLPGGGETSPKERPKGTRSSHQAKRRKPRS